MLGVFQATGRKVLDCESYYERLRKDSVSGYLSERICGRHLNHPEKANHIIQTIVCVNSFRPAFEGVI